MQAGDIEKIRGKIREGKVFCREGHHVHGKFIREEESGNGIDFLIILMQAEDQLMNTKGFRIISEEFVNAI